jgi:hypothetical protein
MIVNKVLQTKTVNWLLCVGTAKRRSIRVCLEFFVSFCVKTKSKYVLTKDKESEKADDQLQLF